MAQHQQLQQYDHPYHLQQQQSLTHKLTKTATAVTLGGSLMLLSGLTLAATVIGLVVATPLLVIFSPVLVPAGITVFLLVAGFLTSGGLGTTATLVLTWMYRYVAGKHPMGSGILEQARDKIVGAAQEIKGKAEHLGQDYSSDNGARSIYGRSSK